MRGKRGPDPERTRVPRAGRSGAGGVRRSSSPGAAVLAAGAAGGLALQSGLHPWSWRGSGPEGGKVCWVWVERVKLA